MRLTCPNCRAAYEVADSMIPPAGRDVQCSNCETTWFQPGRAARTESAGAASAPAPGAAEGDAADGDAEDRRPRETPRQPTPDAGRGPDAAPDEAAAASDLPPRRRLDPELQDMLREERARTEASRRREGGLETQADLDLSPPPRAPRPEAPAEAPEAEDDADDDAPAAARGLAAEPRGRPGGARRDLLPDIEQINSTLRATGDRTPGQRGGTDLDTATRLPRQRAGFRIGFLAMIVLAVGLGAAYFQAGRIAEWVPQAQPVLDGYFDGVDGLRVWLDGVVRGGAGPLAAPGGDG